MSPYVPLVEIPPFQSAHVVVVLYPKALVPVQANEETVSPFSSMLIGTWIVVSVKSLLLFATLTPVVNAHGPLDVRWSLASVVESESQATQVPGMPAAVAMSAHSWSA